MDPSSLYAYVGNQLYFQVKTVVFDKTGTITHGKPEMNKICLLGSHAALPLARLLAIIGTAEANSEHPIGIAIVEYAKKVLRSSSFGQCKDFESQSGYGIRCKVFDIDHNLESSAVESYDNQLNQSIASKSIYNVEINQNILSGDSKKELRSFAQ